MSVSSLIGIVTEIVTIPGRLVTPKSAASPAHSLPRCKRQVFNRIDDCDHLFGMRSNQLRLARALIFWPDWMSEPEILENISTLQRWLAGAWRRLGDPALTAFDKRELRNQMKQADGALRKCLALATELKSAQKAGAKADARNFTKPELRFLA